MIVASGGGDPAGSCRVIVAIVVPSIVTSWGGNSRSPWPGYTGTLRKTVMAIAGSFSARGGAAKSSPNRTAASKDLSQQRRHRLPALAGGPLVVGDAGDPRLGRPRVGEAVLHAAVEHQLPVDAAAAHLPLELEAVLGRDDRVLGTDEHE